MYEKPLPQTDVETAPYWQALCRGQLLIKRCADCGEHHFYPRALCPHCYSERVDWVQSSGRGAIYTFTVARRPAGPSFQDDCPYIVALVQLDEGPRLMTNILDCAPEAVSIGQRVTVDFVTATDEITLPKFRVESPNPPEQESQS
jgi:uncharacterized OB-fold protein